MIDEEEFMDIRALHRHGLTYAEIGRIVGRDWRTVKWPDPLKSVRPV